MTINRSPSIDQKSFRASASSCLFVGPKTIRFALHSQQVVPVLERVLGIRGLFLTILLRHVQLEKCNVLPFAALILLLR